MCKIEDVSLRFFSLPLEQLRGRDGEVPRGLRHGVGHLLEVLPLQDTSV